MSNLDAIFDAPKENRSSRSRLIRQLGLRRRMLSAKLCMR